MAFTKVFETKDNAPSRMPDGASILVKKGAIPALYLEGENGEALKIFDAPGEWSNDITNLLDPSLDASGLFCRDNGDGTIVLDGRIYSPTTTVIMNTGHIIFRMPIAPDTQRTISAYIHADSSIGVYGRITEARVHLNVKTNGDIEFIGAVNATGASQIIQYTSMYFNYTLIRK